MSARRYACRGLNVAIGGPQGVGKTTVLRLLASRQPDYEAISVGDQFPADFRNRSEVERARIRDKATEHLSFRLSGNQERVLLVDLHYLDLREANPQVQKPEILDLFDLHVLFSLPADLLAARRAADSSRNNRSLSVFDAKLDLAAHMEYFRKDLASSRAFLIDCQRGVEDVANELQRHVDASLTRANHRR